MQNLEDIKFPVFRKYKNNQRFYKIINSREFEEIQQIGSKKLLNLIKAEQLPEINLIHDLVYNYDSFAEEISENEYQMLRSHIL